MNDEELTELLPWYVNNTLSAEERAAVEDLLSRSDEAKQEVEILKAMSEQIQLEQRPEVSELGWKRLQRDINRETKKEISSAKPSSQSNWFKPSMAAAAAMIVALQLNLTFQDDSQDTTQLLGDQVIQVAADDWVIQLQISEDTQWKQVSEVLQNVDARIVSGPSAIGVVKVAVASKQSQYESRQQLIEWLQAQNIFDHVAGEQ